MPHFFITLIECDAFKKVENSDSQFVLSVQSDTKPVYLSDFTIGKAKLVNGYSGCEKECIVSSDLSDNRKLRIHIPDSEGYIVVSPSFKDEINPVTHEQEMVAERLQEGQVLCLYSPQEGVPRKYLLKVFG